MNAIRYIVLSAVLLCVSCRGDSEQDVPGMDQVLRIYIQDAQGVDLLDPDEELALFQVTLVDFDASTANLPVQASKKEDSLQGYYLEYIAGAERTLDSETGPERHYYSNMGIQLRETAQGEIDQDTLRLEYKFTPQLFSLERVFLNENLAFTRVEGKINSVIIKK